MILKTTQEVKNLLPRLLAKLNSNTLMPNFDRAEQKYLLPLVGQDLYQEYLTLYNAGPTSQSDLQKQILKNMQLVVASQAFLDELATSLATITDAGIQSQQTPTMPRVYGWEYKAFRAALQDAAADAVDILLQSLELNKNSLPNWLASPAEQQFQKLLIRTGLEFSQVHPLFHPQRTFYSIRALVAQVQEQVITGSLGTALVQWFLAHRDDLTDPQREILGSLQASLAFYSIKRTCEHYSIRLTDAGFSVVATGDPEDADTAGATGEVLKAGGFLVLKMQACERDGAGYLARARKQLAVYAKDPDAPADFLTALMAGPLATYDPSKKRDVGNSTRKGIYRM